MIHIDVIRPVHELLATQADEHQARPAISDAGSSVSYVELNTRTATLAAHLADLGVRRGDRVLLLMPNSVAVVECLLAVVRAEGTAVCLNPSSTPEEFSYVLGDCRPVVVIADDERADIVQTCLEKLDTDVDRPTLLPPAGLQSLMAQEARSSAPDGLPLDDPAWMLYTSGTTGHPKGVLLTQRGMLWVVAAAWLPFLRLGHDDVIVNPLPLSHSYPLDMVLATVASGGHHHVLERFSTTEVVSALQRHEATVLLTVPTTLNFVVNEVRQRADLFEPPFPALRCVMTAGARPPMVLVERAEESLAVPVVDAYGSTEASTAIVLNSPYTTRVPGSCGVPVPGLAVRIVDPATGVDVAVGEEGELVARSPGIMLGYHNRAEETAAALHDGWYWSGDLARQDRNGIITISGRVKDIIIRGGENIAPAEIEQIAMRHPEVADCAAVRREDETYGEVPVLFVVLMAGASLGTEAVQQWCAESLPPFKVPARIELIDEIPKTASGKVKRHLL